MLTVDRVTQISGKPKWCGLSDDGRWAFLQYGDEKRVIDASTGQEFRRVPARSGISQDAQAVLSGSDGTLVIDYLDGTQVKKFFPHDNNNYVVVYALFTADSQRLWTIMADELDNRKLALLDVKTLAEIDSVPLPVTDNFEEDDWGEPFLSLDVASDTLILQQTDDTGYWLRGLFFFRQQGDKIQPYGDAIHDRELIRMSSTMFSASGDYFAADSGDICFWRMTGKPSQTFDRIDNLTHIDGEDDDLFLWDELAGLTFIGETMIALVEHKPHYELRVVDYVNDKVIFRYALPTAFEYNFHTPAPLRGQSLLGIEGEDVVIYRLSLQSSGK